jgi:CRP-like cAMP-binding protein
MDSPLWANLFHRLQSDEKSLPGWLSTHPLLSGIAGREMRFFSGLLHRREYREGEYVFRQGDVGSGFFLVRSGTIHLHMEDPLHGEVPLATLSEGSIVGELSIFDNSPRPASAVACSATVLYGLFEGDLDRLQATRPTLASMILRNLGTLLALRVNETNERLRQLESSLSLKEVGNGSP